MLLPRRSMRRFQSIVESNDASDGFNLARNQLSTITETDDETVESDKERGREEEATDGINLYFNKKQRSASPLGTSKE